MAQRRITKFDHFPKDFLSGYGRATDTLSKAEIQKRIKFFTFEMIRRPAVGVSEFAGTVNANAAVINKNIGTVFKKDNAFKTILENVTSLTKNLDINGRVRDVNKNLTKLVSLLTSPRNQGCFRKFANSRVLETSLL